MEPTSSSKGQKLRGLYRMSHSTSGNYWRAINLIPDLPSLVDDQEGTTQMKSICPGGALRMLGSWDEMTGQRRDQTMYRQQEMHAACNNVPGNPDPDAGEPQGVGVPPFFAFQG